MERGALAMRTALLGMIPDGVVLELPPAAAAAFTTCTVHLLVTGVCDSCYLNDSPTASSPVQQCSTPAGGRLWLGWTPACAVCKIVGAHELADLQRRPASG